MHSRRWILGATFAVAAPAFLRSSLAQEVYPSRPIKLIVPWAPGGVSDIVARVVAEKLGPHLGGTVIVENRPGASGFIGTSFVASAPPDGYTAVHVTSSTHALGPQLFKSLTFDPIKDFAPVSQVISTPAIMVTRADAPWNTVTEFVAAAKVTPGELNYGSFGKGSSSHLVAELFQLTSGIRMQQVPYKGGAPVIADMLGSAVNLHAFFDNLPSSLPYVLDGRLKALGVTSEKRSDAAPQVPTIAETYAGFEFGSWQGFAFPARTPSNIVEKVHTAIDHLMAGDDVRKKMLGLGATPMATTPQQFAELIRRENERWAELVVKIGIERQSL